MGRVKGQSAYHPSKGHFQPSHRQVGEGAQRPKGQSKQPGQQRPLPSSLHPAEQQGQRPQQGPNIQVHNPPGAKAVKQPLRTQKHAHCPQAHAPPKAQGKQNYISAEQARYDEVQLSQRERIAALTEECNRLSGELAELRGREEQIKSAFITATQNADKMTADVKARYAAELERLRLFRAKWISAYDQLKDRYHFDKDALNMESVAVTTQMELQKFLMQDFSLNKGGSTSEMEDYFRSEVERLTTQQINEQKKASASKAPVSGVAELKDKIKEAENKKKAQSAAFSFEEALNPTESLADICKSLGLNAL